MTAPQTRLALRVSPGARESEVVGRYGERWKVRVSAAAESGRANEALLAFLAKVLEVPRAHVRLSSGLGGRDKIVVIDGIDTAESVRRLASAGRGREQ